MLPEEMMFPPAVPQNPQPYGHSDPWRSNNPYSQPDYMPPPPPEPSTPAPVPRRKKLQKKHGGDLSPQDHFPEQSTASADVVSVASYGTRPGSRGSPQSRRHGGSLSPETGFDQISQVR